MLNRNGQSLVHLSVPIKWRKHWIYGALID